MKKLCSFLLVCLMLICVLTGCGGDKPERYRYDPETRVVLSKISSPVFANAMLFYPDDQLEYALYQADAVVEGTVTAILDPIYPSSEHAALYTIEVKDIWFGECSDKIILELRGDEKKGISKVHLHDEVILIVKRHVTSNYIPTLAETSIFVKNPPNDRIYSFSDHETCTAFDGKTAAKLKKGLQKKLNNIAKNGPPDYTQPGKAGESYLEAYEERSP